MPKSVGYLLLAAALLGLSLWRGYFRTADSPADRKVYLIRMGLWIASIVVIAWPLNLFRDQMSSSAYVLSSFAILGGFFVLGMLVAKHHGPNKPSARGPRDVA